VDAGRTAHAPPRDPRPHHHEPDRRYRLTHRLVPIAAVAGAAFAVGAVVGALHTPGEKVAAERFAAAWERGDHVAMHRELSDAARRSFPLGRFRALYAEAAATATALRLSAGPPREPDDDTVTVPVAVRTRIFGIVRGEVRIPFVGQGEESKVDWGPELTFPGVARGERLTRRTRLPRRAALLARDGQVLASGDGRGGDETGVAGQVLGELGPVPPQDRSRLRALGYPDDARVGVSGLERALQERLAGRPGGTLEAGADVLARSRPRAAPAVRTTISPKLELAAVNALGGQSGGVAVLRPSDGAVLALAGTAFSATGPPGSIFKIVTTVAALEDGKVKLADEFPVETAAVLSGVRLANAHGACGGSFVHSFAESCNSVFAPLGVKVGKRRLVEVSERFGFNEPPPFPGAAVSQIPQPSGIGDDLDLGSTAIGQGKVLTSPLAMASMAATIANRGRRALPRLVAEGRPRVVRVTSPAVAATVRRLMIAVVKGGTGSSADISGVQVAGKTGTAELGLEEGDTDAWFVAFAPARRPRVAVAVWRLRAGAGGDVAAPIARQVLAAALSG
jgi:hypothetical protein